VGAPLAPPEEHRRVNEQRRAEPPEVAVDVLEEADRFERHRAA
jgi:hypothetical protein